MERGYTNTWLRVVENAKRATPYCVVCGWEGSRENPLTGDHIIPKSQGGESVGSNVQVLCRVCNSRKGTRW